MARFRISSHGRLQDWIAVEHGYFDEEGLDYEFDVRALENAAQDVAGDTRRDIRVAPMSCICPVGAGRRTRVAPVTGRLTRLRRTRRAACGSCVFGASERHLHPRGLGAAPALSVGGRRHRGWLPLWQPFLDHSGARAIPGNRSNRASIRRLSVQTVLTRC